MRSKISARSSALALLFVMLAARCVVGQHADIGPLDGMGPASTYSPVQAEFFLMDVFRDQAQKRHEQLEQPTDNVSMLDLKAPAGAMGEFQKGVKLLLRKDVNGAVQHLSRAVAIYPRFVSAHNSLGTAYMDVGDYDKAREHFQQATLLDDHLPNPFSNLCHAELALKNYPAAVQAIKKASSLSPLNLDLSATLIYAEVLNHNYEEAIATTHQIHGGKHEGAAVIHFWAAAAWREQKNLPEMEAELKTFLAEDPKSPRADKARQLISQIDDARLHPHFLTVVHQQGPSPEMLAAQQEEQKQIAEAERSCEGCSDVDAPESTAPVVGAANLMGANTAPDIERVHRTSTDFVLRKTVDEVSLFFAATDRGKAVSDLTQQEVGILDEHQPPAALLDFRNESQLPLRLGLVIDASESIQGRFSFEKGAAAGFLQKVLINKDDLAFVVGFANSILMVQDFSADQGKISHAIGELAPAGGTALWDAVTFAANKLASREDPNPVAKILVIISDGNDNSSKTTLKEAVQAAEKGEVIVYTVSTAEASSGVSEPSVGDHALKVLAEQSGGSAFAPGSVSSLKHSLAELQEVIRARYRISYKPANLKLDGHYRTIDVSARRSGHTLRVYARKGYFATEDKF
ncbi:MAG: VWA domain-containing protein [Terriglobales bacterium]